MNKESFDKVIVKHSNEISCDTKTDIIFEQAQEFMSKFYNNLRK